VKGTFLSSSRLKLDLYCTNSHSRSSLWVLVLILQDHLSTPLGALTTAIDLQLIVLGSVLSLMAIITTYIA
jgi:hypothetical protein